MKSHLMLAIGALFSCWATLALAKLEPEVSGLVPQAQIVGTARLKYFLWNVYDAKLYTSSGQWRSGEPFALELTYLRDLNGDAIAKRSVEEIQKQGFTDEAVLSNWYRRLIEIIPDVKKGTRLTGVVDANSRTHFFRDGEKVAHLDDPLFSKWFFNIWLGDSTSEPKLRQQLLGLIK
ncbi:MAG: chalcone isomerase family protein [Pseudohongiellaceae bacterium]|nr:chalcone isomerase family protein [Pseudohongiellaceae bacterium]